MKEYLIDIPVKTNIWIRPKLQRKQFEIIKKARPSILFLQSDGGRNEEEWKAIHQNRKIFEDEVDWKCTIHKIYAEHNLGLYTMGKKVADYVWEHVDRCIFLEDDIIPSVSYFRFCAELLEKYKDDYRINSICGFNPLGVYEQPSSDYFFTKNGSVWGKAYWKRSWDEHKNMAYREDEYTFKLLQQETRGKYEIWRRIKGYAEDDLFDGHVACNEFFDDLSPYSQHQVLIMPKYSMVSCCGVDENSVHFDTLDTLPHIQRKLFCQPAYELEFPLKHPVYVIPDEDFEKKRNYIMGTDHPFIRKVRKIERVCLLIRKGRLKYVFGKMVSKIKREKSVEN